MKWIIVPIVLIVLFSGCVDLIHNDSGELSLVGTPTNNVVSTPHITPISTPQVQNNHNYKESEHKKYKESEVDIKDEELRGNISDDAPFRTKVEKRDKEIHIRPVDKTKHAKNINFRIKTKTIIDTIPTKVPNHYIVQHIDDNGIILSQKLLTINPTSLYTEFQGGFSETVIGGVTGQFTKTYTGVSSGDTLSFDSVNVSSVDVNVTNTPQQYIEVIGNGSMVSTETNILLHLFTNIPGINANTVFSVTVNGTRVPVEKEYSDSTGNVSLFYSANTTVGADFTVDVYWDNNGTEPAADSTYGSEAVYITQTKLSYLLNSATSISDSTSYNNDGTPTSLTLDNSSYGKKVIFNDVGDRIAITESASLAISDDMAISFSFNSTDKYTQRNIITKGGISGYADSYWQFFDYGYGDGTGLGFEISTASAQVGTPLTPSDYNILFDGNEHEVFLVYKPSTHIQIWMDGVKKSENTVGIYSSLKTGKGISVGKINTDFSANARNGKIMNIGHIQIYNAEIQENYITTTYNNTNNPTATGTDPFYKSISTQNVSSNITIGTDTSSNHNLTDGAYTHIMSSIQQVNSATPYWNNPNTATVNLTIYTTDNPLQTTKTYANGYKNGTMFVDYDTNLTNVTTIANLDTSSVDYSGTIVDLSTDQNVTDIRYNSTNVIWNSTQVNTTSTHWYNYSLPVNNASINAQANQTCEWNTTCIITTSASDVDNNTIYWNTTINGTTISGENPEFTNITQLSIGTHDLLSNVTDKNGTITTAEANWPFSNLSKVLTVSDTIAPPPCTDIGNTTGDFWVNWTCTLPTVSDFSHLEVWINSVFNSNITVPYFNYTASEGQTVNIELKSVDIRNNINATTVTDSVTMNTTAQANQIIGGW